MNAHHPLAGICRRASRQYWHPCQIRRRRRGFAAGVVVGRSFDEVLDEDRALELPIKKISGARFDDGGAVVNLSAPATRLCCTT
jgi:hypothetical protein